MIAAARDPAIADIVYKGLQMHGMNITPEEFQKRVDSHKAKI
jgi:hypothetical protein